METFIVLTLISFIYAVVAAYNMKGKDCQIVGAFLMQLCFCYYLSFLAKMNDALSIILSWNLGLILSLFVGGSIGGIVGEYIKTNGKRTIGYWLYLAWANIAVLILGVLFLIFSL